MSHHYIQVTDLSYTYPDGTKVLKNITFRVSHGDSVAVLGENGSGKTTLLKHLNGTILPMEGEIDIGGIFISKKTLTHIRSKVGMVFQNTDNQLFMPTVEENIVFGLSELGLSDANIKNILKSIAEELKISHLLNKHPFKLSGGEKRKICIASVLASSPEILVLDEPTSELDPKSSYEIIQILSNFQHTKIIATHNLDLAQRICNRSILIKNGEIMYYGDTDQLFRDESILREANLIF
ncbi:MAG: energy-coupling factor ABC transporter ATP-binding protein [Calditerrivibrio sp.]|uniref:energy-coupling factor ABC transporter ATP-binding protein n=1 Tax=Calditerrivibrio sp. TaxID=2792612 RepID=UPI003D0ECB06